MRFKTVLIGLLCLYYTQEIYAQRHYTGISSIEASYGMNMFGRNNTHLNLGYSKYRNRTSYWKLGFNYFEKSFSYNLPSEEDNVGQRVGSTGRDYYIDANYYKTVATNLTSLYLSLGIGAYTGVEYYKMPEKEYDFILGPKIGAEIEYFILPKTALIGRINQYWSPFSDISHWNTIWNVGVKILIY